LVPEKRQEVTTEGGLDVVGNLERVRRCVDQLHEAGIIVSLFIDPVENQIEATKSLGCAAVELHTGRYADAVSPAIQIRELEQLRRAGRFARECGLHLHFGHGLTYRNVQPVAAIPQAGELNIGHSIVARAIMVGFSQAVREMRDLIVQAGPADFATLA
jgi:pyridoxine 5-phosphate synthase